MPYSFEWNYSNLHEDYRSDCTHTCYRHFCWTGGKSFDTIFFFFYYFDKIHTYRGVRSEKKWEMPITGTHLCRLIWQMPCARVNSPIFQFFPPRRVVIGVKFPPSVFVSVFLSFVSCSSKRIDPDSGVGVIKVQDDGIIHSIALDIVIIPNKQTNKKNDIHLTFSATIPAGRTGIDCGIASLSIIFHPPRFVQLFRDVKGEKTKGGGGFPHWGDFLDSTCVDPTKSLATAGRRRSNRITRQLVSHWPPVTVCQSFSGRSAVHSLSLTPRPPLSTFFLWNFNFNFVIESCDTFRQWWLVCFNWQAKFKMDD